MGNLAQRALVAFIAGPAVMWIVYAGGSLALWGLVFFVTVVAMHEFFSMALPAPDRVPALLMGAGASALWYWGNPRSWSNMDAATAAILSNAMSPALLLALVLVPGIFYLFRYRDISTVGARFTATLAGSVYVGLVFPLLAALGRDVASGADWIMVCLLIAWFGDTGGYFAGRFWGHRKLYEAVSPKKTWAGAIGGLAASVCAVALMKALRLPQLGWSGVLFLGIVGGSVGQLGDLAESLLKRSFGVKDSGAILPGHGGMLDRIDAVLFITPVVVLYVAIAGL